MITDFCVIVNHLWPLFYKERMVIMLFVILSYHNYEAGSLKLPGTLLETANLLLST